MKVSDGVGTLKNQVIKDESAREIPSKSVQSESASNSAAYRLYGPQVLL